MKKKNTQRKALPLSQELQGQLSHPHHIGLHLTLPWPIRTAVRTKNRAAGKESPCGFNCPDRCGMGLAWKWRQVCFIFNLACKSGSIPSLSSWLLQVRLPSPPRLSPIDSTWECLWKVPKKLLMFPSEVLFLATAFIYW